MTTSKLTPEEQRALVEQNLGLATHVAARFAASKMDADDLVQEARLGLIDAAARFDPTKGKFSTYASWHILKAIMDAIRNRNEVVRRPRRKGSKVSEHFSQVKDDADMEKVWALSSAEPTPAEATLAAEEQRLRTENDARMREAIAALPHRDGVVIRARHGLCGAEAMTLLEVSRLLGVSPERVRQIQAAAEEKLRRELVRRAIVPVEQRTP